jgi:hypothetical protein
MGQSNWLIAAQNKNKIGLLNHPQLITARSESGEVTFFLYIPSPKKKKKVETMEVASLASMPKRDLSKSKYLLWQKVFRTCPNSFKNATKLKNQSPNEVRKFCHFFQGKKRNI